MSRAFIDARLQTINGGTTAIVKEIIGRDLALGGARTLLVALAHAV